MKKSLLFLLSVFTFASCDMQQDTGITSFVNDEDVIARSVSDPNYNDPHFFDVTQYADSVKFVRLETTDDNRIEWVNGVLFSDDYIIIPNRKTASILFFGYDGKYSHKIHKCGQAQDEYLRLSHVMLDRENEIIIVYDIDLRAMLYYDFQGNLISKTDQFSDKMAADDIINLPSGDFLCYQINTRKTDAKQAGMWRVKKDGSFNKYIYTIGYDFHSDFAHPPYYLSQLPDNKVSFVDQSQTAVFFVDDNDVVHKRVQFKLPGKTARDLSEKEDIQAIEGYYSIYINEEKGDFIFTQWTNPKQIKSERQPLFAIARNSFSTILTKSTGKVEVGMGFNSFAFGVFLPGGNFVKNNDPNICTSWFLPASVNEFLQGDLPPESWQMAEKVIEGIPLDEIKNSNPIIQLLYIKK